jgi:hypothetical protein
MQEVKAVLEQLCELLGWEDSTGPNNFSSFFVVHSRILAALAFEVYITTFWSCFYELA